VPPTSVRCLPRSAYPPDTPAPEPTLEHTACVLGLVAAWLEHVAPPAGEVYDPDRFARDPRYAGHMADFNVLTYLIDHRDGRSSNILLSDDPKDEHVYSIDNGIA